MLAAPQRIDGGYLAPLPEASDSLSSASSSYLSPDFGASASQAVELYGAPEDDIFTLPSDAYVVYDLEEDSNDQGEQSFGTSLENVEVLPNEPVISNYETPLDNIIGSSSVPSTTNYDVPSNEVFELPSESIVADYGAPLDNIIGSSNEPIITNYDFPSNDVFGSPSGSNVADFVAPSDNIIGSLSETVVSDYEIPSGNTFGSSEISSYSSNNDGYASESIADSYIPALDDEVYAPRAPIIENSQVKPFR